MPRPGQNECVVITASDGRYFSLAQGCIQSVRDKPEGRKISLAFFDLGCDDEQLAWLRPRVDYLCKPELELDFPGHARIPEYFKGLLARPFLRRYFPDHEIYLWLDADAWVQDWRAIELFKRGARRRRGMAVVPEIDRGNLTQYGRLPLNWAEIHEWYEKGHGSKIAAKLHSFPMINAGVFALHCDAPHWRIWEEELRAAVNRNCSVMTDQIALNVAIYARDLFHHTELLPAWCNWTCHYGLPSWDEGQACLVETYLPHSAIGIVHLTLVKHERASVQTTAGGVVDVRMRYPSGRISSPPPAAASIPLPPGDYVSPGLTPILPDACFPNIVVGDPRQCSDRYLRRDVPHNWYVDRRIPNIGFLNRDEASILYNTALRFRGKSALEIGCWLGWSACHVALAGVKLDVIDPLLNHEQIRDSVVDSLRSAQVLGAVNLVGGVSPDAVEGLAASTGRKWQLIFIDGNHDAPAPLRDAVACDRHADHDALIAFHDLASPEVAQGLDYLADRGWRTKIYQTMQIMGVAWRGNVQPVEHIPDPSIPWTLPAHLHRHPISGQPQ